MSCVSNCNDCGSCIWKLEQYLHPIKNHHYNAYDPLKEKIECVNKHYEVGSENPSSFDRGTYIDGKFHCFNCVGKIIHENKIIIDEYYQKCRKQKREEVEKELNSFSNDEANNYITKNLNRI